MEAVAADPELTIKLWRATSEVLLREAPFLGSGTSDHHGNWQREVREDIARYWQVVTWRTTSRCGRTSYGRSLNSGGVPLAPTAAKCTRARGPLPKRLILTPPRRRPMPASGCRAAWRSHWQR